MRRAVVLALAFIAVAPLAAAARAADSYVLRDGDVTYMLGKGMPAETLKALQDRFGPRFLWARRQGKRYLVRDAAALQKALEVLQRNVASGPDRDQRIANIVDAAVKAGTAQELP